MEIRFDSARRATRRSPFMKWLLQGADVEPEGAYARDAAHGGHKEHTWWKVMCLTGVDYFSTLGYQPGIAFIAAGALSPLATVVLVLLTLFGAFPVYSHVAKESPHGQGSIAMLERVLGYWWRKLFVLALLGFAATDFIITITLSAADASEHLLTNPVFREKFGLGSGLQVPVTIALVLSLGAVFLKGFKEAVGIAVVLVITYLSLVAAVLVKSFVFLASRPDLIANWRGDLLRVRGSDPIAILFFVCLIFPKLALGLSGFETGVAVMGLVKGKPGDTPERPVGRIANTRRLLLTAALIMSVFLIFSSLATTVIIPKELMMQGGSASARALSYLAHKFFGDALGTVFDVATIFILWFAGASAMAGLLNLVPKYLPRYGMAPEWTKATRPLVLVFVGIACVVTVLFRANVEAQGAAYATGVLFLMTSAAFAVAWNLRLSSRGLVRKALFWLVFAVFVYTFVTNTVEKPDGLRIAAVFIGAIVLVSLVSRIWRTLELRVESVHLDLNALEFIEAAAKGDHLVRVVPNRPDERDEDEYRRKTEEIRRDHDIPPTEELLFLEIEVADASDFTGQLQVRGERVGPHRVLRAGGVAVPNAIAAFLMHLADQTAKRPHAYFNWGESSPFSAIGKLLISGQGDIAPVTREIVRRASRGAPVERRPVIHVAS